MPGTELVVGPVSWASSREAGHLLLLDPHLSTLKTHKGPCSRPSSASRPPPRGIQGSAGNAAQSGDSSSSCSGSRKSGPRETLVGGGLGIDFSAKVHNSHLATAYRLDFKTTSSFRDTDPETSWLLPPGTQGQKREARQATPAALELCLQLKSALKQKQKGSIFSPSDARENILPENPNTGDPGKMIFFPHLPQPYALSKLHHSQRWTE